MANAVLMVDGAEVYRTTLSPIGVDAVKAAMDQHVWIAQEYPKHVTIDGAVKVAESAEHEQALRAAALPAEPIPEDPPCWSGAGAQSWMGSA